MAGKKLVVLLAAAILLALSACGGQTTVTPSEGAIQTAIAQTDTAEKKMENAVNATLTAVAKGGGQETPLAGTGTLTPSTMTGTPGDVTVTVSTDTWCNKGPGSIYGHEFLFKVGQTAVVIGRDYTSQYWVIEKPDNPTVTCWLWGKYATITGDPGKLPVIAPPPTPTTGPGKVISVSVEAELAQVGCPMPGNGFYQKYTIAITTDGPATVSFYMEENRVLVGTTKFGPDTLVFSSAGTRTHQYSSHLANDECGHYVIWVYVTSPNPMSAQTTWDYSD